MNTLLRRSYELPDVAGDRWTDQYKPTVIGTAPCRVAAEAMLSGIEWDSVFHDEGPGDPLERLGTLSVLQGDAYISRRDENTLIAWFASRLHRVDMCMTDGHEDEDFGRYFNDCWDSVFRDRVQGGDGGHRRTTCCTNAQNSSGSASTAHHDSHSWSLSPSSPQQSLK